ncbi:MAG: hypothetical protein WAW13_04450 [Minisyncoccia bacterium]
MSKPSQGQVLNAIGILINNADWEAVSASTLQKFIDKPKDAGREFTDFLKGGGSVVAREPKVIPIDRTHAFDPVAFIGNGWSIVEQDERSLKLGEVDLTKVSLKTMLRDGEETVDGETKLRRLIVSGGIRLDAKVFQTLWENQHLIPMYLKEPTIGNTAYVFFDGTILRYSGGGRCVLCLCWRGGKCYWYCFWLGGMWRADRRSAVLPSFSTSD